MRDVQDYRARAIAARSFAGTAPTEQIAGHYRAIAAQWELLAEECISILQSKREPKRREPKPRQ
jgi:hypothetical protein